MGFARTDRGQALFDLCGHLGMAPNEVLDLPPVVLAFLFTAQGSRARRERMQHGP